MTARTWADIVRGDAPGESHRHLLTWGWRWVWVLTSAFVVIVAGLYGYSRWAARQVGDLGSGAEHFMGSWFGYSMTLWLVCLVVVLPLGGAVIVSSAVELAKNRSCRPAVRAARVVGILLALAVLVPLATILAP